MMGDFPYAEGSLSPWDVNYKGLLADEAMSWVFRPSEKAKSRNAGKSAVLSDDEDEMEDWRFLCEFLLVCAKFCFALKKRHLGKSNFKIFLWRVGGDSDEEMQKKMRRNKRES
ncbi:hypothetical protein ACET3Z_030439 [Daucus carota]